MNYFDDPDSKHFSFESFAIGLERDTFGVINFTGFEAISKSYDFEIMLLSSRKDIDFEEMLQSSAVFTIHRGTGDDVLYNGILAEFDQLHEVNDVVFYRARLVPKLWWLTLTHHNQVFLKQSVPDFVDDALRDGGLESADFNIAALTGYEEIDYICQYDESHFNFVSRWLERQGIYYYFDQEVDGEVLMLTDTRFSHHALKQGADLFYNPASGLEGKHLGEAVGVFTSRQKQLPAEIILRDYNYERPSLDITSRANVDVKGRGVSYIYGEFFATAEEGERLAGIRAEELLCQKQEFFGESTVPYIMPGFTFNMHNHYRENFNQEYLILEVTHEGNQSHLMIGGIAPDAGKKRNQAIYRNSFKAIPNHVQYRPQRITEKPKISGTIHANIDSEVEGEYAQIDEQGRYRVKLPFDINDDHLAGKGSAPIRMMQAYAGKKRGMQFPLVKGTEVLLTFIEGNPDRPIIAGAVANTETQGPVNHDNQSESVIQTGGNNRIRMEDKAGSERMVLESPAANSWIRIGSTNDPIILNGPAVVFRTGESGEAPYNDQGAVVHHVGSTDTTAITYSSITKLNDPGCDDTIDDAYVSSHEGVYSYEYVDGNDTAIRTVYVGRYANDEVANANGIRIRTAGVYWNEGRSRVGDYIGGPKPLDTNLPKRTTTGDPTNSHPNQLGDLISNFGAGYNPTGLLSRNKERGAYVDLDMTSAMADAQITVSSMDTFNTQEGNIYDFGGYWNYNLGNSFAEEHIDQSPELNKPGAIPWPDERAGEAYHDYVAVAGIAGAAAIVATTIGVVTSGSAVNASSIGGGIACAAVNGAVAAGIGAGLVWAVRGVASIGPDGENFQGNIGDVIAGPGSGPIETWAKSVGSSFTGIDPTTGAPPANTKLVQAVHNKGKLPPKEGPMHTDTTWVTKQFGDSYNFNRGNDLSIRVGNTEEHTRGNTSEFTYGGIHEETKFNGDGRKVSYERGGGGSKTEINWHHVTGQLTNYSFKWKSWFSYEGDFVAMPTVALTTSVSSLRAKIDISVGAMDINASLAVGITMNIKATAGLAIEFERSLGGKLVNDETTQGFEFKAVGMKAAKKAAMEADAKNLVMEKVLTQLGTKSMTVEDSKLTVRSGQMTLDGSTLKFF